jgi:hypothetical protein
LGAGLSTRTSMILGVPWYSSARVLSRAMTSSGSAKLAHSRTGAGSLGRPDHQPSVAERGGHHGPSARDRRQPRLYRLLPDQRWRSSGLGSSRPRRWGSGHPTCPGGPSGAAADGGAARQYLVDVARGHGQTGGDDQALRALLTAEHLAPEEVRYQSAARVLVAELCIGSGQGASQSCVLWLSASAPSPDVIQTGRAPWRVVPDRLRDTSSP